MRSHRRPPLVEVGAHGLHLVCRGRGHPAVVLEAALTGCHLNWYLVQEEIARATACCSYDRAGLGWSDPGPPPRTARRLAAELHELLARAGVPPPYVLVAHSFGAWAARVFAAAYPDEMCALVLVDPAEPSEWCPVTDAQRRALDRGAVLCRRGALAARLGVASLVARLSGRRAFRAARFIVGVMSRREFTRRDERILAPFLKSPAHVQAALRRMWVRPACFEAIAAELDAFAESAAQVAACPLQRGLPVTVLSASDSPGPRLAMRDRLAKESLRGRHVVAPASGHWIQLDQPELVVSEVRRVLREIRSRLHVDDPLVERR